MLGPRSRVLVVMAVVVTFVLGALVYHQRNTMGGAGGVISMPKLLWLCYTVLVWGLLCPILAYERRVRRPFRVLVGAFAALIVTRFAAELPMLYVWKNWRPPYGMALDITTVIVLIGGLAVTRGDWSPLRIREDRW